MATIEQVAVKRATAAMKEIARPQRMMYQAWKHAEKLIDYAYAFRDEERSHRRFDSVQDLTEAIYHLKKAMAHLRHVARNKYNREPEDLKAWQ